MNLRILFIDDESRILEGLRRSVRPFRNEWDAKFANGGEQGLQMLADGPFDVVVTDMRMPGLDGVEVLEAVMERHPHLLRVILSGYADTESIIQSAGVAHQYLTKPCRIEDIKSAIDRAFSMNRLLESPDLRKLLSGASAIPSLPRLYSELTRLINDPDSSMADIGALVSRDIGMSAKVLQLVNSAFFGRSRSISDPTEAIRHLGLGTLKALSVAVQVFKSFELTPALAPFVKTLWDHSFEVSLAAGKIAGGSGSATRSLIDDAAMAGLLHDVGTLTLACKMPELYAQACALAAAERVPMWQAEQAVFNASHAEAGGYIMAFWGLPPAIVEAIAYHHTPSQSPSGKFCAVTAVHLADALIDEQECGGARRRGGELDQPYLEAIGLTDRINEFREIASLAKAEAR